MIVENPDRWGDRSVSPVIGVVLMVAITVVLAATAAAMFFAMGDSQQSAPSIALSEDVEEQTVTYTVDGGEPVDPDRLSVTVDVAIEDSSTGATTTTSFDSSLTGSQTKSVSVGGTTANVEYDSNVGGSQVGAGDSFEVDVSGASSDVSISESEAAVAWEGDDGSSAKLYSSSEGDASSGSVGGGGGGGGGPPAPSISATTQLIDNNGGDNSALQLWVTNINGGSEIDATDIQVEVEVKAENPNTGATETVTKSQPESGWTAANEIKDWDPTFTSIHGGGSPFLSYGAVTNTKWNTKSAGSPTPHINIVIYETGNPTTFADYRITLTHEPSGTTIYQESTF